MENGQWIFKPAFQVMFDETICHKESSHEEKYVNCK